MSELLENVPNTRSPTCTSRSLTPGRSTDVDKKQHRYVALFFFMSDIDSVAAFKACPLLGRPANHGVDIQLLSVGLTGEAAKGRRPQSLEEPAQQPHRAPISRQRAGDTLIRAAGCRTFEDAAPIHAVVLKSVVPLGIATNSFVYTIGLQRRRIDFERKQFLNNGRQRAVSA